MEPKTLGQLKKMLEEEAERLEAELEALAEPDPRMAGDWDARFPRMGEARPSASSGALEEQADEREEYEAAMAQEQTLESRLAEVRRALERMAAGTYGICARCGAPIPAERLQANPAAEYHVEHEPQAE